MSQIVMRSGLDWTIVRFLQPEDGPAKGTVRNGFYGTDKFSFGVTRADIAAFTAAQVDDDRYIGQHQPSAIEPLRPRVESIEGHSRGGGHTSASQPQPARHSFRRRGYGRSIGGRRMVPRWWPSCDVQGRSQRFPHGRISI
jgi:NAD(P)H-binding